MDNLKRVLVELKLTGNEDMMFLPQLKREAVIEALKVDFPNGTRVEMTEDIDECLGDIKLRGPRKGDKGTIRGIDGIGQLLMKWDNGSSVALHHTDNFIKIVG